MLAVVLHVTDVFEAPVDLTDVGFDLVTPISPDDDEGGAHAAITHSGQRPTPYLGGRVKNKGLTEFDIFRYNYSLFNKNVFIN